MKFIIFSFHPTYVSQHDAQILAKIIEVEQKCRVYLVPHMNHNAEPIYCVQLADTGDK